MPLGPGFGPFAPMTAAPQENLRPLIERVCVELELNPMAARAVEQWIKTDPADWPDCCLSGCDPCNAQLRAAALKVLDAIGGPPPPPR